MKPWEQRVTGWGSVLFAGAALWIVWHLERDRFQNPLAAPVGVTWEKERVFGGVNTAPVQYADLISLHNASAANLEGVEISIFNWANGTELIRRIGTLEAGKKYDLSFIDRRSGFPHDYEINPRDVLIVRCNGYADKRIPVKELGKDKTLRAVEKEEDKENNADPQYWPKFWKWLEDQRKQGVEPTEAMFKQWLRDKEAQRRKDKDQASKD